MTAAGGTPPPSAGSGSVDLEGWDLVQAVLPETLNATIKKNAAWPTTFSWVPDKSEPFDKRLQGNWGPWQIEPSPQATGKTVQMTCEIAAGQGAAPGKPTEDLSGAVVTILVDLEAQYDPQNPLSDPTASDAPNPKAETRVLRATDKATGPVSAVQIVSIKKNGADLDYQNEFRHWFNSKQGIADFDQPFHQAVLNVIAKDDTFQWLKPSHLSYANLATKTGGALFAALTQTVSPMNALLAHQISPALLDHMPKGCNGVIALSAELVTSQMLLKGAVHVLDGSIDTDFTMDSTGRILSNNKALLWRDMVLPDGTKISPTVPKDCFIMEVEENRIKIQFKHLSYLKPLFMGGNEDYTLSFTQHMYLGLVPVPGGSGYTLMAFNQDPNDPSSKNVPDLRDCNVTVTPDKAAMDADRTLTYVSMALALVSMGSSSLAGWAIRGAKAAKAAASVRAAIGAGEAVFDIMADADDMANALEAVEVEGNLAAAAALTTGGAPLLANYATFLVRFGILTGILSGILTGAKMGRQIKVLNDGEIDTSSVPPFDDFLNNVLGPSNWPGYKKFTPHSARLAGSLLVYGKIDT
ncbi:TULIP family P47-like protein [Aliiruegeria sabulilitoris]|uniref:TULIP family P47-like protein n=1 Tax=Aliiruegeria sabulilitoris TaxID=1510458 RepID=UPI0008331302|nr:TULIP family P47-like protein [Aliiruegeria sabulilitoris]